MRLSFATAGFVLLFASLAVPGSGATKPATQEFLSDSFVIARVGDRPISVYAYRDYYFASDITLRPQPDSLGRVEFLQDLINKEILGQTALKTGYEFKFEDRLKLREFGNQALANLLFMRTVNDSSLITEDSLRKVHQFYSRELKLRILYFADRSQAEYARQQLIVGRLLWSAALARYGVKSTNVHNGVSDWIKFQALPLDIALQVWPLRVGELSPIILASSGYHIVQVADSRATTFTSYAGFRRILRASMRSIERSMRKERIRQEAKQGLDVVYDSTNVRWVAAHFREAVRVDNEVLGAAIEVDENVPEFTDEDQTRALATWKGGQLALSKLLHEYTTTVPMLRPSINTPERLIAFIDAVILAPRLVEFAIERGLDKEPAYLGQLARRREAMLVEHMVEDSVLSRIYVTREERRTYYDQHHDQYVSYPEVRYAVLVRTSKAAADSARSALAAGVPVDTLVAIDQRRGVQGSGISTVNKVTAADYSKILFEELRPGKNTIVGPDRDGLYAVIHELAYDPGKLLPYERVEASVDESVRNVKGDAAMRAFITRHASQYRIESHPESLMRISLTDPYRDMED